MTTHLARHLRRQICASGAHVPKVRCAPVLDLPSIWRTI